MDREKERVTLKAMREVSRVSMDLIDERRYGGQTRWTGKKLHEFLVRMAGVPTCYSAIRFLRDFKGPEERLMF